MSFSPVAASIAKQSLGESLLADCHVAKKESRFFSPLTWQGTAPCTDIKGSGAIRDPTSFPLVILSAGKNPVNLYSSTYAMIE